jgi:hypothetical protein
MSYMSYGETNVPSYLEIALRATTESDAWTPSVGAGTAQGASSLALEAAAGSLQESACWHCQGERQCSCIACLGVMPSDRVTAACVVCQKARMRIQ